MAIFAKATRRLGQKGDLTYGGRNVKRHSVASLDTVGLCGSCDARLLGADTTVKHPVMREREEIVRETLKNPDQVRQSQRDPQVYLFYKSERAEGRSANMAQVKVFYDREGNTLTVWFGDPQQEYVCEETGEEVILIKDASGQVIGFEKLNYVVPQPAQVQIAFETVAA